MNARLGTIGLAVLIGIWAMAGSAADETAQTAAESKEVAAPVSAGDSADRTADSSKSISLTIGGKGKDAKDGESGGHGLTISVNEDDDEVGAKVAGKVVEHIVDNLEKSLENLPADVRREIDADDMKELRGALAEIRAMKHSRHIEHHEDAFDSSLVPGVLAILLLFGGPIVIVALVSYNNRRKRQMVHETIDRIIAQGKDVPVELLDALDKGPRSSKTMLSRGVVNLALGVGIGGMLYALGGDEAASIGLIPFCIGAAQLLVWKLEKPAQNGAPVS